MSERVADQIGLLLRRISCQLNRKLSDLFMLFLNHKRAGSLGAIAGFAIAVVFAWKFLRSPRARPRRAQQKRAVLPSRSRTSNGVASSDGSDGPRTVEESMESESLGFEASGEPVELTLGQKVRKKLGGCRKMTCQLLGVILQEKTPEELQEHATVRLHVLEIVVEISKYCDLYLMETVLDDESEERVLSALEAAGVFEMGGLIKDKVLFCSNDVGRTSFVRQLEADWHVDSNLDIVSQLSRFIRCQLYISQMETRQIAPNVLTSTSLEQFFS